MWSRRPSARPGQQGFTLVELMIGVLIGLLATLAVTHVLVNSEGQKRSTSSGSDAQVNGALALNTLQRQLQSAGYGFGAVPPVVGCTLTARFAGAAVAGFPASLAPVTITDGASGAPDAIRILASGKTSFSIPLRIVAPGYAPPGTAVPVGSVRTIVKGDLVVVAQTVSAPPGVPCEMFRVSDNPGSVPQVARTDDGGWNNAGSPTASYGEGGGLINLGVPIDSTYSVLNNALVVRSLSIAGDALGTPSYPAATELYPNIVQLQAFYGKDTNADGSVDTWDNVTPTTNALWQQVMAVRLALVARSPQYEKEEVTPANVSWDVGSAATVAGSATCGTSRCVTIKLDTLPDWKHYRYKVFETVVPLRNLLWNS
ncbi:PilW family protein [Ramlibacter sp. AN1133]|uniref:PilW family protein n=1 Tax=Ramlibacter sp. AN1133 TaxID=3133429 RepID=UPI0030C3085D